MNGGQVKPGNGTRTVWRRGPGQPSERVLLYFHGFSASPGEAGDLPEWMAERLDASLYVHRWPGHGESDPDAMRGLTVETLRRSALNALQRALLLSDSVAIVGSSLGASLGLWLASTFPKHVAGVVA